MLFSPTSHLDAFQRPRPVHQSLWKPFSFPDKLVSSSRKWILHSFALIQVAPLQLLSRAAILLARRWRKPFLAGQAHLCTSMLDFFPPTRHLAAFGPIPACTWNSLTQFNHKAEVKYHLFQSMVWLFAAEEPKKRSTKLATLATVPGRQGEVQRNPSLYPASS